VLAQLVPGRRNSIRVVPGGLVTVEVSPYDLRKGQIVYRGRRQTTAEPA
jgi:translation initiation factor IF-1